MDSLHFVGIFLLLAGLIVGLGAVTVIDIHGFLGRKSSYWTEATTRAHRVTKPLIWAGITLAIIGGFLFYRDAKLSGPPLIHLISAAVLIINGIFLSFSVSPFLLERERTGRSGELIPASWQVKITIAFVISFIAWWGNVLLFAAELAAR